MRLCLEVPHAHVPWSELQMLILEVAHGSRMVNDKDHQHLRSMVHHIVHAPVLSQPNMPLAPVPQYFVPNETTLSALAVGAWCSVHGLRVCWGWGDVRFGWGSATVIARDAHWSLRCIKSAKQLCILLRKNPGSCLCLIKAMCIHAYAHTRVRLCM